MRHTGGAVFGLWAVSSLLCLPRGSWAQGQSGDERQPAVVVGTQTSVVRIDVVVTRHGQPALDLGPDVFEVSEDGHRQAITHLAVVRATDVAAPTWAIDTLGGDRTNLPPSERAAESPAAPRPTSTPQASGRVLIVVVDDLSLALETLQHVRPVLLDLIKHLEPGDRAAVVRASLAPKQIALSAETRTLEAQVEALTWNPRSERFKTIKPIALNAQAQILIAAELEGDAGGALEESRELFRVKETLGFLGDLATGLGALPGRKSVVLLSDSLRSQPILDRAQPVGRDPFGRVADAANQSSVAIYTLDTRGVQSLTMTADDEVTFPGNLNVLPGELRKREQTFADAQTGMRELAEQTGGLFLAGTALENGLHRVLEDSSAYYLIGYTPDAVGGAERRLHHIKVKVKKRGHQVRARRAYYG